MPSLDGLRACSVALVIFDHLCISGAIPLNQHWIDFGNLGVRVFFVISGFIITRLLLQELDRTGSISLRGFYIRRVFRIVPIWAFYVASILLIGWRLHETPGPRALLAVFTFNVDYWWHVPQDLQHLWSLSVEEKFYLLWPVTLLLAGRSKAGKIAAAVVAMIPIIRFLEAVHGMSYENLLWRFQNTADAISMGCLLALYGDSIAQRLRPGLASFLARPRATVAAVVASIAVAASGGIGAVYWLVGPTLLNLAIAVILYGVVSNAGSKIGVFLNTGPMRNAGVWSYGIYLWQQPFTLHRKLGVLGHFPINVVLLVLVAVIGYYAIERPAQEYGRRISRRLNSPKRKEQPHRQWRPFIFGIKRA